MAIREASYAIAPRGLATSFTESEQPIEFASIFRNRFINAAGGAEKRQGIVQKGSTISGAPDLDGAHELIKSDGIAILFASGNGRIYRLDTSTWTQVHAVASTNTLTSVQMGDKLIFSNGSDADFFTEDGAAYQDLNPIIEAGQASSGTDGTGLIDSTVTNWVADTNVAVNDLVRNRTQAGYGVVTAIVTASVAHTLISPTATGIGVATATAASGDMYEILDLIELNIIPTDGDDDNAAIAGSGTTTTLIAVSAVSDWTLTKLRVGDYIRNSTRTAVTQVTAISTATFGVHGITSQTSGDSLIFLKSAMPVTKRNHVHFGRLYHIDQREQRLIRISGANNPNDMTTSAGTLDSSTVKFGEFQPQGDTVLAMASFQRLLVIAGKQNVYLFQGTDPIADESTSTIDFSIIGLFPQGVVSPDGLVSIGNDVAFVSTDGVQTASLVNDSSTLGRSNISEAVKTTLRDDLAANPEAQIKMFHYPRRSWLCLKVGSQIYVFNYTASYTESGSYPQRKEGLFPQSGSWSIFDGKFARQNAFLVRRDGTLVCVGPGGMVFEFDQGTYDDDGETYTTQYRTAWFTMDEPKKRANIKTVNYLKPVFEGTSGVTYTISGEGGFQRESSETITVDVSAASPIGSAVIGTAVIGGSGVENVKRAFRLRGEYFRIDFTTNDQNGPDVLSKFTVYGKRHGKR